MNSLERRLIMISRLAAKGDEFLSTRPHVPLIIECDAAGKVALAVSLADVPPENRVDLFCCQEQASIDRLQEAIEQGPPPGAPDPAEDWLFTFEQETQEREQQNQDNDKGQGY